MQFGAQLFGINAAGTLPPEETFRRLKEIGYSSLEPCVALEPIPGMEKMIWPLERFRELLPRIRALGLEVFSCHVFAQNLLAHLDDLRALAVKDGVRHFVVKTPAEITEENLQAAALVYRTAADALAEVGASLLIHNEGTDIAAKAGEKTAYERLLDLCGGKVFAQVDVGWVHFAGEDPVALLARNRPLVKSIHYKDFKDGKPVAVGAGELDLTGCFRIAQELGIPHIVDQDSFDRDVLEEMAEVYAVMAPLGNYRERTVSYLNVLNVETGEVTVLRRFDRIIEAPNWLKKSDTILFNADGRMFAYNLTSGTETLLDTGECTACNNDHVVSPDEKYLAVSHMTFENGFISRVYIVPLEGGEPRLVTPNSPSFLHGWSPDGGELAYCAFREIGGRQEVDVYTIPAEGGEERRLTGGGFNDGPEYSPDGEHLWYNSTKSGLMQVWRMKRDGSQQTQMTRNHRNNWFGHVSPDGRKVLYLSYAPDVISPAEHLPNMPVELWLMNADGSDPHRVLSLFGGQGSVNVNSWARDSKRFAFVSYELI